GELGHFLLDQHEAPELPGKEVITVSEGAVIRAFPSDHRSPFERILSDIDDRWHVGRRFFARPAVRRRAELEVEVVDADRAKIRSAKIEELMARRRSLSGEQVRLVIAVEVVLVGAVAQLHAV